MTSLFDTPADPGNQTHGAGSSTAPSDPTPADPTPAELSAGLDVLSAEVTSLIGTVGRMRRSPGTMKSYRAARLRRRRRGTRAATAATAPWWGVDQHQPSEQIRQFGTWLRDTYALTTLPTGWADDPALHGEITALYAAWAAAYSDRRATATQPLQWHEAVARAADRIDHYQSRRRQRDSADASGRAPASRTPAPAPATPSKPRPTQPAGTVPGRLGTYRALPDRRVPLRARP